MHTNSLIFLAGDFACCYAQAKFNINCVLRLENEGVKIAFGSFIFGFNGRLDDVSHEPAARSVIKPISDLRNKANKISELAHKSGEPIFITKNGEGDMVVMSMAQYSKLQLKLDLFSKSLQKHSQRKLKRIFNCLSEIFSEVEFPTSRSLLAWDTDTSL